MQLRSGKVTKPVPVPWPRPSDVQVKQFPTSHDMAIYIKGQLNSASDSLTKRRFTLLEATENIIANPKFIGIWQDLLKVLIRRLDEEAGNITTFNASIYANSLRTLIF